jgi:16S rRNA (adenine1518-N6/adenine1519-N6)-dimethyltransferase
MRARKRFAQHFLEPAWGRKVVELIAPREDEFFLEIGPGRGALTTALSESAATVVAVEIDRDLTAHLRDGLPPNVGLVEGDVLEVDLAQLFPPRAIHPTIRVVGNLPYNITSPILFRLVDLWRRTRRLSDATLMVQFEVSDRILAAPGGRDYGPLAIGLRLWSDATRLLVLPPGAFRPAPRVRSALVQFRFREPTVLLDDEATFDRMVRALFTRRRKTLANALEPFARSRGRAARDVLDNARIDASRRPETPVLTHPRQALPAA